MTVIDDIMATEYPAVTQELTERDAILYALGIGIGEDPLDSEQLKFVYERSLRVFPTMAITLCYHGSKPGAQLMAKLDQRKTLHVYQDFELLKPIPLNRRMAGKTKLTGAFDKGSARGIVWTYQNRIVDEQSGELICVLNGASMNTAAGGVGGPRGTAPLKRIFSDRAPDEIHDIRTLPQAALIYRLSGDYNPFHVDPEMARAGGFPRPILHGRCTFGVAGRAILAHCALNSLGSLRAMEARFTASVYPGETISTQLWREGDGVLFRCFVKERQTLVLDQGYARFFPP